MKNIIIFVVALLPYSLSGQLLEAGIMLGTSTYFGDLQEDFLHLNETNFAGGILIKYNINDYVAIRGSLIFAKATGDDSDASVESGVKARNLHFRSNITEFSIIPEVSILGFNPFDSYASPYVFAGLSIFRFNPQAELNGEWYDLQPLTTEGQGLEGRPAPYNLTQLAIPFGVGFKYAITEYWTLGIEYGWRYTFTDYLDDVSTTYPDAQALVDARGEIAYQLSNRTGLEIREGIDRGAENRDFYNIFGVTITYNFVDGFGGSKYGCPNNF